MDKKLMRKKYDKEERLKELKLNIYNLKKIIDLLEITTSREEDKNILEKTKNDYKENIIKINKIKEELEKIQEQLKKECNHEVALKNLHSKDDYYCPICDTFTYKKNINFKYINFLSFTKLLIDIEYQYSSKTVKRIYEIIKDNIITEKDIIEEIKIYLENIQYDNDIKIYVRR